MTIQEIAEKSPKSLNKSEENTVPAGYKKSEVGVIPEDWDLLTIEDIATFSGGSQPPRRMFISKPQLGYIRLVQIRDYKTSEYETYIPESLSRKKCLATDIMIGRYGPPIFQILRGIKGAYNVALIKAIPKEKIEKEYLYYFLKSEKLFELMDMLSQRSSGQTGIELPALKAYPIPLPPKKEQIAIALVLSDVDKLIDELKKLITKKQAIKTATMQHLLTGRTRLPPFALCEDGSQKGYKPSELGEIPEDWEVVKLGEIGQTVIGLTYSPKDVSEFGTLVLRSSNVQNGKLAYHDNVFVNMQLPERVMVKEGDILVCVRNGSRQLIGKCALIDKATVGAAFGAFMSIYRSDVNNFIFYQFQSNLIQEQINERMGATINQITNKDMAEFVVAMPKRKEEQSAIAIILSDMDKELQALEQRLSKTCQIKQGMMQELLTGKTRLVKPEDDLHGSA